MDLLRHWRRGTFGAAAGALVVPAVILLAAVAVGLGGGGLGSLGSIGQALNGPNLPSIGPLSERRPAQDAGRLLARAQHRRTVARHHAAAVSRRSVAVSTRTRHARSRPGATTSPGRPTPGAIAPSGGGVPTAPTPAPTAVPTPAPRTPLRKVGDTVESVTDRVPLAGAPVHQVVDDVVNTVDSLLPPPPG
jgi:hypothetical protein